MLTLPSHCSSVGNVGLEGGDRVAEITSVSLPGSEGKVDVTEVMGLASRQ